MTKIPINFLLNDDQGAPAKEILPSFETLRIIVDARESLHDTRASNHTTRPISTGQSPPNDSPSPILSYTSVSSQESSTSNRPAHRAQSHRNRHRPYGRQARPNSGRGTRQFRPSYEAEEAYFIWYHRIDLALEWAEVIARFTGYFGQGRTGCQGIQCKYYRFSIEHGLPPVRQRHKDPIALKKYSLRLWEPEVWYDWMRPGVTDVPAQRA